MKDLPAHSATKDKAMIIKSIEAFPIRLPARRDFKWAGLRENLGGFVVVRLETEGGEVGVLRGREVEQNLDAE